MYFVVRAFEIGALFFTIKPAFQDAQSRHRFSPNCFPSLKPGISGGTLIWVRPYNKVLETIGI